MRRRLTSIWESIANLGSPKREFSIRAELRLMRAIKRLRRSRPKAVDLLIAAADDPDPQARFRAVWVLASTRLQRAYRTIVALTRDPDGDLRYDAVMALGRFGYTQAIPLLIDLVRQGPREDHIHSAAAVSLQRLGQPAVRPLIELLRCDNPHARRMAAYNVGSIGGPSAIEPLDALRSDADTWVRIARVEALAEMAEKLGEPDSSRCLGLITDSLKDPDEAVRRISQAWLKDLERG